jgi:hypothetical protein
LAANDSSTLCSVQRSSLLHQLQHALNRLFILATWVVGEERSVSISRSIDFSSCSMNNPCLLALFRDIEMHGYMDVGILQPFGMSGFQLQRQASNASRASSRHYPTVTRNCLCNARH